MSARSTRATRSVGTGMVGAPACGDVMKLQIKVNPADRRDRRRTLQDLRLRLGHRVELAGDRMGQGQDAGPGGCAKNSQIAEELALPPVKIHCSILAEDAIKAAVDDYKKKHASSNALRQPPWPVTLTEAAARHVTRYLAKRGKGVGVRLGVKTTGCSGLAYKLEYVDELAPEDMVFEDHGVKVLVDPKSLAYIDGTELDFVREGLNEGFKFNNPNERDRCGCGESLPGVKQPLRPATALGCAKRWRFFDFDP